MSELSLERAQEVIAKLVELRLKWGNSFQLKDHPDGPHAIMDAVVTFAKQGQLEDEELRAALTKSNRQLGASKTRETKLKQQVAKLKEQLKAAEVFDE